MDRRARELIDRLGLEPHPEGGYYRQLYRSTTRVVPDDGRHARAAMTTIFFLLTTGGQSRWHRVLSDEIWHFYEGEPLEHRRTSIAWNASRSAAGTACVNRFEQCQRTGGRRPGRWAGTRSSAAPSLQASSSATSRSFATAPGPTRPCAGWERI
jgi:hypothetical protein